jgi:ribonuclease D
MLIREKRLDIFKKCLEFLDTRVELDQKGFKEDIFEH